MSLSDIDILELLQLSTRLTLHYESILAREEGVGRPYALGPDAVTETLRRTEELLAKEGREIELHYGEFSFVDSRMVSAVMAEALDILCVRYSLEPLLDSQVATALRGTSIKE